MLCFCGALTSWVTGRSSKSQEVPTPEVIVSVFTVTGKSVFLSLACYMGLCLRRLELVGEEETDWEPVEAANQAAEAAGLRQGQESSQ